MQPHFNLGINFRKHFEPFGFSKKRSLNLLKRKLEQYYKDIKSGILHKEYAKDQIDDLLLKTKLIKRGRL